MINTRLFDEGIPLERRWALFACGWLIVAFICPLALGGELLFGPGIVAAAPPPYRLLALVPGVLGPGLLVATLKLDGLRRAVVILIGTGLGIILMIATVERLGAAPVNWGPGGLPAARAIVVYAVAMTVAFAGLGLLRAAPDHLLGLRIAGVAGAVLVAVHFAPLGGRTMLGLVLDPISWRAAWPIPLAVVLSFAFAALCAALLLGRFEVESTARFALLLGLAAVLAIPVGTLLLILGNFPPLVPMFITLLIKYYGMWIALHVLLAAGLLGLVQHGFVEPDQTPG